MAVKMLLYITFVLCQMVSGYPDRVFDKIELVPKSAESMHTISIAQSPLHLNAVNADDDDDRKLQATGTTTATVKPPSIELDDIFLSVKTTKGNHDSRLNIIQKTWFQQAKQQTWFFTDAEDKYYQKMTNNHLVNTNCSTGHYDQALCCKMSAELDKFLEYEKKWFCHFDDDNYVNIPRLVSLLNEYNPAMEWYLGKPSVASQLEINLEHSNIIEYIKRRKPNSNDSTAKFWFATGGAGFCISRALSLRMLPVAGNGKLIGICDRIRFPDDVTVGFVIENILNISLTVVDQFHSHLEPMENIQPNAFRDQVSFSYRRNKNEWNVVKVDGFDTQKDPTRIYSLHCHLFPYLRFCAAATTAAKKIVIRAR